MSLLYDDGQSGLIIHANPTSPFYFQSSDALIGGSEVSKEYLGLVSYPTLSTGRHGIHHLPGSGKDCTQNHCMVLA